MNLDSTQITAAIVIGLAAITIIILLIIIVMKREYTPYVEGIKVRLKDKKFMNAFVIILTILAVLWVAFDTFSPIGGGNIRYYVKWIECGQKPVMLKHEYKTPAYYGYGNENDIMSGSEPKFCSPREAELNGYTSGPQNSIYEYTTLEERRAYRLEHGRVE